MSVNKVKVACVNGINKSLCRHKSFCRHKSYNDIASEILQCVPKERENMKHAEIPCMNCVVMVMCRNRKFERIIRECKLLSNTLYFDGTTRDGARSTLFNLKITLIRDILRPQEWVIVKDDTGFIHVVDRRSDEYIITSRSVLIDNEGN